jgi:hypothetical protein
VSGVAPNVRSAIERAAQEHGVDPAFALAVAERESGGDVNARSSKTIAGIYQMRADLRHQYGVGDSKDAYQQASAWMPFIKDTKATMAKSLGRDPTDAETYGGHHFGAGRAARMLKMDPSTPVDSVFTPSEMAINPHFAKAGTVGNLLGSVTSDINKRRTSFGGGAAAADLDFSQFGEPVEAPDFSQQATRVSTAAREPAAGPLDFSQFGTPT